MSASRPVLSHLRRRSFGAVWLCTLLILLKLVVVTGCLATDTQSAVAASGGQITLIVETAAPFADTDQGSFAADCWHAETGDCHCSCMHAVPLASHADVRVAMMSAASNLAAALPALNTLPSQNELRPPIA